MLKCGSNDILIFPGTRKIEEDSMDIESSAGSVQSGTVFMYQLTAFPPLDPYWKIKRTSVPFTVHTKYEERVNALLADRLVKTHYFNSNLIWSTLPRQVD